MSNGARAIVDELKHDKRFRGSCPRCHEDFSLSTAALFLLNEKHPEAALNAVRVARETIAQRKKALADARVRMTTRAEGTAHAVNLGKIIEKIVPSFPAFNYHTGDCRALLEPIDYLVFSGMTEKQKVEALYFVDVKSGGARLNSSQKLIRDAVQNGAVRFSNVK